MNNSSPSSDAAGKKELHLNKFSEPLISSPAQAEGETIFVRQAAYETAGRILSPEELNSTEFGIPVKDLVGVITYCYARGVFHSVAIADLLRQDTTLRHSAAQLPDGKAIRRFRRRYHELIEESLEELYRSFPPKVAEPLPASGEGQTEIVRRLAGEQLHDAAWRDNLSGRPE